MSGLVQHLHSGLWREKRANCGKVTDLHEDHLGSMPTEAALLPAQVCIPSAAHSPRVCNVLKILTVHRLMCLERVDNGLEPRMDVPHARRKVLRPVMGKWSPDLRQQTLQQVLALPHLPVQFLTSETCRSHEARAWVCQSELHLTCGHRMLGQKAPCTPSGEWEGWWKCSGRQYAKNSEFPQLRPIAKSLWRGPAQQTIAYCNRLRKLTMLTTASERNRNLVAIPFPMQQTCCHPGHAVHAADPGATCPGALSHHAKSRVQTCNWDGWSNSLAVGNRRFSVKPLAHANQGWKEHISKYGCPTSRFFVAFVLQAGGRQSTY